uniref:Uncharacterized protein n=1 Tax=Paramormyrops kingsleyae TaxID=1676925 RepID=A0A3B3QB95_9TELE
HNKYSTFTTTLKCVNSLLYNFLMCCVPPSTHTRTRTVTHSTFLRENKPTYNPPPPPPPAIFRGGPPSSPARQAAFSFGLLLQGAPALADYKSAASHFRFI